MKEPTWLIRLYPRAWRERYAEEFEILLQECLHSPLDVLDVLLAALDAHLEYPFEKDWRYLNMVNKLRTAILAVFAGYIGFVIGGLSFYGLVDDSPAATLMKSNTALAAAWTTVEIGAVTGLLALVFGGLPLAWTAILRAYTSSRKDLRLLLVPVFAFLALLIYGVFMASIAQGWLHLPGVVRSVTPGDFPVGNRVLLGGFMLLFVIGVIASTAAVVRVVMNTEAKENTFQLLGRTTAIKIYEFTFPPAVITALSMLLMLIATLIYGGLAYYELPDWFEGNYGLLLINTTQSYTLIVLIMTISTAAALWGITRGISARSRN